MSIRKKTFAELGIFFEPTTNCITCGDFSCHANAKHKKNGKDYNVHISPLNKNTYTITATLSANSSSDLDIEKENLTETEAVNFIQDNFYWEGCF